MDMARVLGFSSSGLTASFPFTLSLGKLKTGLSKGRPFVVRQACLELAERLTMNGLPFFPSDQR